MFRSTALTTLVSVVMSLPSALPARAQSTACSSDLDRCTQANSSAVAISHSHRQPETTVLFRIEVPQWSPGTLWGDGHNGFFYRVTAHHAGGATTTADYAPFNGIRVGTDGLPALPAFEFIVPVDVSDGVTTMEISACSSDPRSGTSNVTPQCTTVYWTDAYDPLPLPAVTPAPPISNVILRFGGSAEVSLAANGVYSDHLELIVDPSLTQEQLDWLFDHLVFFDSQGNAYTNDVIGQGIGILSLDQAAYLSSQDQRYHTKYGNGDAVSEAAAPNQQLFFYTTLAEETKIGATVIYDLSDTCTGFIPNNGSLNPDCTSGGLDPPSISPQATVVGNAWKPDSTSVTGTAAGSQQKRTVQLQVDTATTDTRANCRPVLSPLAVAPSSSGGAQRPPNYVIDDFEWTRRFPNGLYYVLDAGFGNCDLNAAAPFCEQTPSYAGYVPHYLTDGVGGTLNGGSNDGPETTAMDLADEYAFGNIGTAAQNAMIFFDACGYGHRYEEPNVNLSLGTRKTLPAAPNGWTRYSYILENLSTRPLVFGKECCASWYQANDQTGRNEPIQQLGDGFGMFLSVGASVSYQSLFREESIVVYDAATGEPLFKLWLNGKSSTVHACSDPSSSVVVSGSGSAFTVSIGATGSGAKSCVSVGKCPLGMAASQSGSLVTCSATSSTFLVSMNAWREQPNLPNAIQVRAYGARGRGGRSGDSSGGAHGVALTVLQPGDLPDALYAYVGTLGDSHGDGGASTIVTKTPLSFYGQDVAESVINPKDMDVLLIAAGGGGGGTSHDGGNGPPARANSTALPGPAVSLAGQNGFKDNGGKGGNQDGQGGGGSKAGKDGVGGTSHGNGAAWDKSGPLIPPTVDPLDWTGAGHGAHGNASAGGGGFGGGGHGSTNGAGGGGGGSWAIGNTAYDPNAPTGRPASPGGDDGGVQIVYTVPSVTVAPAPLSATAPPRNVVRLTFGSSVTPLPVLSVVERIFGAEISGDVPVYVEAWGGAGGDALVDGGSGGPGGYGRSSFRLADLLAMTTGDGLYLYVGEPGSDGTSEGEPGQGGASTVVATGPIALLDAQNNIEAPETHGILVIAGGGGAGAAGTTAGEPGTGGGGGVAIATDLAHASCGGANGSDVGDDTVGGTGGNGGDAGCDPDRIGNGGTAGSAGGVAGASGVGGFGGTTGANPETPRWIDADVLGWNAGEGGTSSSLGGAGGGGFGGGGSGGESLSHGEGGGGGGGGSWARQSTVQDDDAPVLGRLNPSGSAGAITLTFDVCTIHPDSHYCQSDASFSEIHPRVRTFDEGDGNLRVRIEGDASLDVSAIDTGRLLFGHTMVEPLQVSEPADIDGDGTADLELLFEPGNLSVGPEEVVHCLYGALGTTPFVGCSRVEAATCDECPRDDCINAVCGGCVDEPCSNGSDFDDDGCAIDPNSKRRNGWLLLAPFAAVLLWMRRRANGIRSPGPTSPDIHSARRGPTGRGRTR